MISRPRDANSEIEEEPSSDSELFELNTTATGFPLDSITEEEASVFSLDFQHNCGEDVVYVAINGKSTDESSSMDALVWTLTHALNNPATALVFLVHVFPETKFIPMPLGMIPASQVNPEQRENYLAQERSKRRDFLQKFLNVCSASKVKVDTILIESDLESKAILDLIPILNIRKLVLGTTKSNLRRMRARKGSGTAELIVWRDAPEFCEVKIICQGKEMVDFMAESPTPSPRPTEDNSPHNFSQSHHQAVVNSDTFTCCFKPKVAS